MKPQWSWSVIDQYSNTGCLICCNYTCFSMLIFSKCTVFLRPHGPRCSVIFGWDKFSCFQYRGGHVPSLPRSSYAYDQSTSFSRQLLHPSPPSDCCRFVACTFICTCLGSLCPVKHQHTCKNNWKIVLIDFYEELNCLERTYILFYYESKMSENVFCVFIVSIPLSSAVHPCPSSQHCCLVIGMLYMQL